MNRKPKNIITTTTNPHHLHEEEGLGTKGEESKSSTPNSHHNNSNNNRSMFASGFTERYDLEQYFWTEETVQRLLHALEYTSDCCCLTTPSLGHGFHTIGREEVVLDIDERFAYLPKFRYFDIRFPYPQEEDFQILILDPPFFYLPMSVIYEAVLVITKGLTGRSSGGGVKLMIGFLKREEKILLETFKDFELKETNFPLHYATVKENKWKNYALYANCDLPGIKRLHRK